LCLVLWLGDIVSDLNDGTSALDDYSPGVELVNKSSRDGGRLNNRTGDGPPGAPGFTTISDPFGLYHHQDPIDYSFSREIELVLYGRKIFSLNRILII